MARCGNCNQDYSGCLCSLEDSSCLIWSGSGNTPNSLVPIPVIDPDPDNILTCGPAGFFAPLPDEVTNPPSCRVYRASAVSIPNGEDGTTLTVSYDTVRWDNGGFFDLSVGGDRLTAPIDGTYLAITQNSFASNAVGLRLAQILGGLIVLLAETRVPASPATGSTQLNTATITRMRAGQILSTRVLQNSGGSLNLESIDATSPEFMICYIGPYPEN